MSQQDDVRPYHAADFTPGSRGYNGWCSTSGCEQQPVLTEKRHRVTTQGLQPAYFAHCMDHVWDTEWRQKNAADIIDFHYAKRLERFTELNDRIWGEGNWIPCGTCPPDDGGWPPFHHKNAHA